MHGLATTASGSCCQRAIMPVEGQDGVLFPATFAASEDKTFKGGYNVDTFADGRNIA